MFKKLFASLREMYSSSLREMNFFLLLFILIPPGTHSQDLHVGLFTGVSAYAGDLSDNIFPKEGTKPAVGISGNYEVTEKIFIRAALTYGTIGAHDKYSKKENFRLRNLSFQTSIFEFSILGEYHILDLDEKRFSPYAFAGIGVFNFNPYAYTTSGQKVFLKPLSTEGQGIAGYPDRKPYQLMQPAIPFGGGIKFSINDDLRIGLEVGSRKLFTNYLDDVSQSYIDRNDLLNARSQLAVELSYRSDEVGGSPVYPAKGASRGNPEVKDYYYFVGLHATYRLKVRARW